MIVRKYPKLETPEPSKEVYDCLTVVNLVGGIVRNYDINYLSEKLLYKIEKTELPKLYFDTSILKCCNNCGIYICLTFGNKRLRAHTLVS